MRGRGYGVTASGESSPRPSARTWCAMAALLQSAAMSKHSSAPPQDAPAARTAHPAWAGLIFGLTVLAYLPAYQAGFIWDDDGYVTQNAALKDAGGLRRIWFEIGATPQYYPLVFTTFWIEYRLWGLSPGGYHAMNVLLHAASAVLAWRILLRLRVPGAMLAALLFAVHPVHVESVAWITERKNVLSGFFYLAALWAYWRFIEPDVNSPAAAPHAGPQPARAWRLYALSLAAFLAAMLSKTVTGSLPAAIAVLIWWRLGRLPVRLVWPLAPMAGIAIAGGALTSWVERHIVGAGDVPLDFTIAERFLIAGRAVWFYAAKLVLPINLTFIYPRWTLDTRDAAQWAVVVSAGLTPIILWMARHRLGRGPLAAVLLFGGTLFPALGFISVFPMRYSFVADHFQYLASLPLLTLLAVLVATALGGQQPRRIAMTIIIAVLCGLTFSQARIYRDGESVWRDTLRKNPKCAIALTNLGAIHDARMQHADALKYFEAAVRADPMLAEAEVNLATYLIERTGEIDRAISHLEHSLQIAPRSGWGHHALAQAMIRKRDLPRAIAGFRRCIDLNPRDYTSWCMLGRTLWAAGDQQGAIAAMRECVRIEPRFPDAQKDLRRYEAARGAGL